MSDTAESLSPPRTPSAVSAQRRAVPASPDVPSMRVSASFFRDVVGSLRNGVVVITRDGALAYMNREACRIFGVRRNGNDVGRPYAEVLQAQPEVLRILRAAFELTQLPNRAELRLRNTGKVIGYTVCAVRDARGRVTGATLLFKDLTRVEQLEERERLRDRLAALGEMAAAIAHEVKNPLAGIEVMAGLLRRRMAGVPDAEALLNDIITEAKMANSIVLETLEFVRPIRLQTEQVALARIVDGAISMAESLVPRGTIDVAIDLPEDLPSIEADEHQLRQLFTNLLTNAFEAMEGRGRIAVSATVQPGDGDPDCPDAPSVPPSIAVCVADDGPGVPEEVRDRIFSPFFTTKPRGSGLGLAIVRKIVDAHEGRIDVHVGHTGGTCFRVMLPVIAARDTASPFAAGDPAATR